MRSKIKKISLKPLFEDNLINSGKYSRVIGIDEVGRGSFAGPVAVGAFIYENNQEIIENVNDSKKLSIKSREEIFEKAEKYNYKVLLGEASEIDTNGIAGMIEILIEKLITIYSNEKTFFLIDGVFSKDFGSNTKKVIKGDSTYYSIALASILSKVIRDSLMNELDNKYLGYGFKDHKGYGTKQHIKALEQLGITEIHRKSYKPINKYVKKNF